MDFVFTKYRYTSDVNSIIIFHIYKTHIHIFESSENILYLFNDYIFLNYTSNHTEIYIIQFVQLTLVSI